MTEPPPAASARDPACGAEVDRLRARAVLIRDGATHYFCSAACREAFRTGGQARSLPPATTAKAPTPAPRAPAPVRAAPSPIPVAAPARAWGRWAVAAITIAAGVVVAALLAGR